MNNAPKKNRRTLIIAIILLIVIATLAVGLYFWQSNKSHDKAQSSTANTQQVSQNSANTNVQTNPYDGWKEFCSGVEAACFKYPADWNLATVSTYNSAVGMNELDNTEKITITSPSGTVVSWDTPIQGLGGGCELDSSNEIYIEDVKTSSQANDLYIVKTHSGENVNTNVRIGYYQPNKSGMFAAKKGPTGDCIMYFTYTKDTGDNPKVVMFRTTSFNTQDESNTYKLFESLTYK